jgi:hypothetical protein
MSLVDVRLYVERRMAGGARFSDVENEINAIRTLTEEERSALWLLAWSFVDWRSQRREARAHLTRLVENDGERAPLHAVSC